MNKRQLAQLNNIIGDDNYLYQLAKENSSDELRTSDNDILEPETMQERADEFRKDDSEPIWNE